MIVGRAVVADRQELEWDLGDEALDATLLEGSVKEIVLLSDFAQT